MQKSDQIWSARIAKKQTINRTLETGPKTRSKNGAQVSAQKRKKYPYRSPLKYDIKKCLCDKAVEKTGPKWVPQENAEKSLPLCTIPTLLRDTCVQKQVSGVVSWMLGDSKWVGLSGLECGSSNKFTDYFCWIPASGNFAGLERSNEFRILLER